MKKQIKIIIKVILGILILLGLWVDFTVIRSINITVLSVKFDSQYTYSLQKYPFRYFDRYSIIRCDNKYGCGPLEEKKLFSLSKIYSIFSKEGKLYIVIPKKASVDNNITHILKKMSTNPDLYTDTYKEIIFEYI